MKLNNFDKVMEYIDGNITLDTESMKEGIVSLTGFSYKTVSSCFLFLTGQTLANYISHRKMYFSATELKNNPHNRVIDILLKYDKSEHAAQCRKFKKFMHATPSQVQKGEVPVFDNKCQLIDFANKNSLSDRIISEYIEKEQLSPINDTYCCEIVNAHEDYGYSVTTIDMIFDLSEQLGVPFDEFLRVCGELSVNYCYKEVIDEHKMQIMSHLDIESFEELDKICQMFDCKYYEINPSMVDAYRLGHGVDGYYNYY